MKPDITKITIHNNRAYICELLQDLVLQPRIVALKWSNITKQTPNIKIGYPAQHLASLVTGMEGMRTGARGRDIIDGSEVKGCSKIDQLDTCTSCNEKVARMETACSNCGSDKITRMDDSKWLFTIRSEDELNLLAKEVPRILLIVSDYPGFDEDNFDDIRFEVFEIWTSSERNKNFIHYMSDYYYNIYLKHKESNPNKTPAPKNFFPYGYPFYMCNPIKVLSAIVTNANTVPSINLEYYVESHIDRSNLPSELMPISLLNNMEIQYFIDNVPIQNIEPLLQKDYTIDDFLKAKNTKNTKFIKQIIPFISEDIRQHLSLREVGQIRQAKTPYKRR